LRSHIPQGDQVGGHGPLGKLQGAVRFQNLESNELLELSDPQLRERQGFQLKIGFLDLRSVLPKIWHESEIDRVEQGPFK
jgi:hypothetical protein